MTELSPEVTTSYQNTDGLLLTLFMYIYKPLLRLRFILFIVLSFRVGEKGGTPSESSWNFIGFGFIIYFYCFYSSMIYVTYIMFE